MEPFHAPTRTSEWVSSIDPASGSPVPFNPHDGSFLDNDIPDDLKSNATLASTNDGRSGRGDRGRRGVGRGISGWAQFASDRGKPTVRALYSAEQRIRQGASTTDDDRTSVAPSIVSDDKVSSIHTATPRIQKSDNGFSDVISSATSIKDSHVDTSTASVQTVNKPTSFPCTFEGCKAVFNSNSALKRHKRDNIEHIYCRMCDEDFNDDEAFLLHKLRLAKHICCPVCSEDFKSDGGRDLHIRTVRLPSSNFLNLKLTIS